MSIALLMAKAKKSISPVKIQETDLLFSEIKSHIDQARKQVAVTVNQSLSLLYWNIGGLIHHHILQGNRAVYGKEILATLSPKLTIEFGQSYNTSSLNRMLKF